VCLQGGKLCIGVVNFLLALSALILCWLAFALTTYDCLPIPKFALSYFSDKLKSHGLELSWDHISADLSGGIVIEQLRLIDPVNNAPIFTSDFLYADFDLWAALRGNPFALDSIFLQGGSLYAHPQLSLSGAEESLTRITTLHFQINPHSIHIEPTILHCGSHLITLNGSIPFSSVPTKDTSSRTTPLLWQKQWITLTDQINTLQTLLTPSPETHVHLQFSIGPQQSLITTGLLSSPEIELPRGITLHHILVEIPSFDLKKIPLSLPPDTHFSVASAELTHLAGKTLSLFDIQGKFTGNPIRFHQKLDLTETLTLRIANLNDGDLHAHTLTFQCELPSLLSEPRFSLITQFEGLLIQSQGQIDPKASTASLHLSIQGDIHSLFTISSLHLEALADQTHFSSDFTLAGSLQFNTGYTFESADLDLTARQFSTYETQYDEVYTPIKITPTRLKIGPIAVYDPHHQSAHGYYIQDLESLDYRILARGNIFPRRIDSLLPPFYTDLWKIIDPGIIPDARTPITVPPVSADVDVHARWHTPLSHSFIAIQGENIAYKGQPTNDFSLRLWQANGFVELLDLNVTTSGDGALKGNIAWIFPQKAENSTEITQLELQSTLPLPLLGTVFGPDIADLSTAFELEIAPSLSIRGELKSSADGIQEPNLQIQATVDTPLSAYGIPLAHLDMHAELTQHVLKLRDFTLGFHGGLITGNATLMLGLKDERPILLNVTIKDALYSSSLKTLEGLLSETKNHPFQLEEPNGQLDLTLVANGKIGQWESFIGTGSIKIEEAQLANIRLFGGLSKVFEDIKLPITSFRLNRLESNIILHPGQLYFYDLVVAGPAGRIETPGTIYIPEGTIDFNAKVFFLGSDESGTVGDFFGILISPLAHAFELKLKGTLGEPKWTFKNSPFQLLNPIWKAGALLSPTPKKPEIDSPNPAPEN